MNKDSFNIQESMFWVACSGGVDSIVSLRLLHEINKEVGILHCNFQLRGVESDKDEQFVSELANQLNIPIRIRRFDVQKYCSSHGLNTQLAARELRYKWFEEVKSEAAKKNIIVLGHHEDDQVETFLLQLKRGGKVNGLAAIPWFRNNYFRPLINYKKEEIYALARKNKWNWREDASNAENKYKRNFYRNELLPVLRENNIHQYDFIDLVSDFQILNNQLKRVDWNLPLEGENTKITFELWRNLSKWMKLDLLKKVISVDFNVNELDKLSKSNKGAYIQINTIRIWNEGDHFIIDQGKPDLNIESIQVEEVSLDNVDFKENAIYLDGEKLKGEISFRKWRKGDKFQPLGMKGRKLVSDFLIDKKVPSHLKREVLVLIHQNEIVAVYGFMPDNKFRISKQTSIILKVSFR